MSEHSPQLIRIALPAAACAVACSCASSGLFGATHPGDERTHGEVVQFERDVYGDLVQKKRHSEQQRKQLKDYEDDLRSEEFSEWLEEGRKRD